MLKAIRIGVLLLILAFVALSTFLTEARSTDWKDPLYVKVYPINADDSTAAARYISRLKLETFSGIEAFLSREVSRYGRTLDRPVRLRLGEEVGEQPPALDRTRGMISTMWWSLKLRWWASSIGSDQDKVRPDVRIFVRYHARRDGEFVLENSVGLQKGMVGIVNAYADRAQSGSNNVIIAHEFLHTLGATDKYDPADGTPVFPTGYAEPERKPLHPQRRAEIMGGRIPLSDDYAEVPRSLQSVIIGPETAEEIRLVTTP